MTNDEALRLIKATEYCYVLWSDGRNEVVAVKAVPKGASPDAHLSVLATLWREADGPLRARFFESAAVSIGTLHKQQAHISADTAHLAERRRTLYAWRTCEVDELLVLLETGVFPPTTSARDDADLVIDEIYYARAADLTSQQLARLEAVAAQAYFSPLGAANAYNLECKLAVIRNDRQRLERFWRRHRPKPRYGLPADFGVAAGDLALDLDDVIVYFADAVKHGWPFEIRFNAMIALGKIGAAAGKQAAGTISATIYDSSERVRRLRDRVLLRIGTLSDHWKTCSFCVRGMVRATDAPLFERCAKCLGLGHVQVDAQPAVAADGVSPLR